MIPKVFPFSLRAARGLRCALLMACLASCDSPQSKDTSAQGQSTPVASSATTNALKTIPIFAPTIVKTYPHDPKAFTQGLEFYDGRLYESTGRLGQSTLRECVLETGKILRQVNLPVQEFGEGLTIFRGKIYQLTWLSKKGFIYGLDTFRRTGEFHYEGEGWGLTHDDSSLILSDGSNTLRYIDPVSFRQTDAVEVYAGNDAVANLNELEYIDGEIFANVWHSARIARISPRTGQVAAWIDLSPVVAKEQRSEEEVLNGIAYDHKTHRLFVTGKNWAHLFEIAVQGEVK